MGVAELGAGDGEMTVLMAQRLGPSGRMYATEMGDDKQESLREAVADAGLSNVTVLAAAELSTNLPPACCDAIFMRKVYHHLTDPKVTNTSLFQSLRAGGRVAIIDFRPRFWLFFLPKPDGVSENRGGHGISPAVVIEELEHAGFQLEHRIGAWPVRNYCLVFRKPPRQPQPVSSSWSIQPR